MYINSEGGDKLMHLVSLVIPVYNEEKYIEEFLHSILKQSFDLRNVEMIFVDGNSNDNTVNIINSILNKEHIDYHILNNKKRITPVSLNIGIKSAKGEIIIRLDAHSEYPINYIEKCVYYINTIKEADNVGCTIETVSEGIIGNAIAEVLSSKFGVGNSQFRTQGQSGFVDTVPFGTFRKSLFEKIGYFDERLVRNQDSEFNHRIIKNGGKIYLFNEISIIYHPRNTIIKLAKMGLSNGKWNIYTSYLVPGSMKLRHFVPFLFVASILVGMIFLILNYKMGVYLFIFELLLYLILDIFFSFRTQKLSYIPYKIIIFPIFHIAYGIGSFFGLFKILVNRGSNM